MLPLFSFYLSHESGNHPSVQGTGGVNKHYQEGEKMQ